MRVSAVTGRIFARHDLATHPENQRRLQDALCGLPPGVARRAPHRGTTVDLERVHTPGYCAWLEQFCTESQVLRYIDADTYVTKASFDVACWAAGGAIRAADLALGGEYSFALVRPPGHHAMRSRAMGFCLINNIAVAAAWALERIDRVAIVDWDVHHGNGTQDIFYEDSRVLYCSVHQWNAFPGTGRLEEAGRGKGSGCTLNVPLPPGSTGADYALVFSEVFIPAMLRFNPELILVSAGQDILADDPLGGMAVEPENTGALTRMLITAVLSPLALILEGGYGPSHGAAINAIYRALQGEAIASPAGEAGDMTGRIVREARTIHRL